jgi:hypothetical protein
MSAMMTDLEPYYRICGIFTVAATALQQHETAPGRIAQGGEGLLF